MSNDRFSNYKVLFHQPIPPYPVHVQIDLTGICNHNCSFCFFREGARNEGIVRNDVRLTPYLDGDLVLRAMDDFARVGVKAVTLVGGGEPLLHKDIDTILVRMVERGIEFGVITNLSVVPRSDLLGRAVWIRVSADAASPETYQTMHNPKGGFDFSQLKRNVENLAGKTDIGISFLVHRDNYREIAEAARLFKDLGANYIQYKPVYDRDRGSSIRPHMKTIRRLLDEARGTADGDFELIDLIHRVDDIARPNRNYKLCRIHHYNTQLAVDGKLYPCCVLKYIDKYAFGSLYEDDFRTIWDGRHRKEIVDSLFVRDCPPCWFDRNNEVLEYLAESNHRHANFV